MRGKAINPILASAFLLCGCQLAYHPLFDISPESIRQATRQVDGGPYVVVEVRRFSYPEFACNMTSRKGYHCLEVVPGAEVMPELARLFPALFADTPDAVPIIVMQNIRSGSVADPSGGSLFNGAAGFNKGLSRADKSDMAAGAILPPCFYYNGIANFLTLGLIPFYGGEYSSHYSVSIMTGYDSYSDEVPYSAEARLWIMSALYQPFTPKSSGWRHESLDAAAHPAPDATVAQKRTALCCAIARALAEMPRQKRAALRRNPVALLRDKEAGGQRAFSLVKVSAPQGTVERHMGEDPNRPRIVSQEYDPATRRGAVVIDTANCDDAQRGLAWVRESYLPLVVASKGAAVDASSPQTALAGARVSVTGLKKLDDAKFRIDFAVLE